MAGDVEDNEHDQMAIVEPGEVVEHPLAQPCALQADSCTSGTSQVHQSSPFADRSLDSDVPGQEVEHPHAYHVVRGTRNAAKP